MAEQSIPSLFQDVIGSPIQADRLAADRALGAQLQQGGSAALLFAPERARRLAQTIGGITGTDTRSPEERQQGTIRSIYSSIRFNDPTSVQQGAEALRQAGFPDIANRVIAEGKRIAQVDAKDAAEQAREERAQTRFGYEVADRATAEEVDDITASVQLNADGDMVDYYKRLAAKLSGAGFGLQAKGALEDMRTAEKAMQGGERFVPVGKNIFDREKGIFIDGPNEGREGRLVEEVGEDGRLYEYFVDPVTGEHFTVENLNIENHLRHLYRHLIENEYIRPLNTIEQDYLLIKPKDVLNKIRDKDASWTGMVPEQVASIISERGLFQKTVCLSD
jgi:hypothetical protein